MSFTLQQIARALGGEISSGQVLAPGPGHSVRDRSLGVKVGDTGKLIVKSFCGDDPMACLSYVEGRLGFRWAPEESDGRSAIERMHARALGMNGKASADKDEKFASFSPPVADDGKQAFALKLWRESVDPRETIAETYLASRGLDLPGDIAMTTLRFHPSCPFKPGVRHPCLIAAFRSIETNEIVAIQRTALTPDGKKIDRMMLGPVAGAAIMLGDLDAERGTLTVGEGLESAMSGLAMGFAPAWSLGSADATAKLPVLAGVDSLTILAENDLNGASQRASRICGKAWHEAGREVFVASPKPGYGKDCNDALQARQGEDDVLDVVAFAEGVHSVDDPKPAPQIKATPFVLLDPASISTRKWLYGRHYIRRFVSATVAPGGVGKSSLGIVEALAMVTGRPLLGVNSGQPLRAWLWNGEDPREEMERRIAGACLHYDISAADIGGRLFVDSGRDLPIRLVESGQGGRLVVAVPTVEGVEAAILANKIDVLVIDPFVSSHAVPENDNMGVDRVAKTWAGIAERCNCSIELVHHVRKGNGGEGGYSVEDARGGSSLIGAVRSARVLNVMSKDEADRAGVDPEARRLHFRVDDGKANMAPPMERADWRKLVGVGLGNGNGLEPEDNVGVVTAWEMPSILDSISGHHCDQVIAMVRKDSTYRADTQAANWIGKAIAEVAGLDLERKSDKEQAKAAFNAWLKSGALAKERRSDSRREMRDFVIVGPEGNT